MGVAGQPPGWAELLGKELGISARVCVCVKRKQPFWRFCVFAVKSLRWFPWQWPPVPVFEYLNGCWGPWSVFRAAMSQSCFDRPLSPEWRTDVLGRVSAWSHTLWTSCRRRGGWLMLPRFCLCLQIVGRRSFQESTGLYRRLQSMSSFLSQDMWFRFTLRTCHFYTSPCEKFKNFQSEWRGLGCCPPLRMVL